MTTLTDYAALSAIVYNDVRQQKNKLSPLPGRGVGEFPGEFRGQYIKRERVVPGLQLCN